MFLELEKVSRLHAKDVKQEILLLYAFPIDANFERFSLFFSYIGYMANQISIVEDEIRAFMMWLIGDRDKINEITNRKNFRALFDLFELAFKAKYHDVVSNLYLFEDVKIVLFRTNRYRNDAVHYKWMYPNSDSLNPCYEEKQSLVFVPVSLMKKRAQFTHYAYKAISSLRAVTEIEEYDEKPLKSAADFLANLHRDLNSKKAD